MNKDDYWVKRKAIEAKFKEDMRVLNKDYSFSHSTVKVGDIVEDHYAKIEVKQVRVSTSSRGEGLPECVYLGYVLTKKGLRRKDGDMRNIWQSDQK